MGVRKGLDSPPAAPSPSLDLAVLRAQTGGDAALEREVLDLFVTKSEADFARIRAATTSDVRRAAAHALVGSARAVGATEVARLASLIEHAATADSVPLDALREGLDAAQAFIRARR